MRPCPLRRPIGADRPVASPAPLTPAPAARPGLVPRAVADLCPPVQYRIDEKRVEPQNQEIILRKRVYRRRMGRMVLEHNNRNHMPSGAQARRRRKEKGKSDFSFLSPDAETMEFALVATQQSTCGGAAIQTIYTLGQG